MSHIKVHPNLNVLNLISDSSDLVNVYNDMDLRQRSYAAPLRSLEILIYETGKGHNWQPANAHLDSQVARRPRLNGTELEMSPGCTTPDAPESFPEL